jgi:hypothetical protein
MMMNLSDVCSVSGCISAAVRIALRVAVIVSVLFATASGQSVQPHQTSSGSVDAIKGIVSALHEHPVVLLGEDHWLLQAGDFYIALLRDPGFQEAAQDIVVEFASRSNQALLDRYIGGEDISFSEVEHIWRDTTKVASWESPIYANWLATIRQVNKNLPSSRRIRVLAGDTPIDWNHIHTHSEWAALGDNNASFAEVIASEVLAKRHHALVVLGAGHVKKASSNGEGADTTARIDSRFPGSTFVVLLDYWGLVTPDAQKKIDSQDQTTPAFYALKDTTLGAVPDRSGVPLTKQADALLYLGPPTRFTMAFPGPGSLEPDYLEEVDRRSMIEWGELRARKFLGPAAH